MPAAAYNPFVELSGNNGLFILQSLLDNLHDFQGRASKPQIKKSEANIVNNFFIKYNKHERIQDLINAYNELCIEIRARYNLLNERLGITNILNYLVTKEK